MTESNRSPSFQHYPDRILSHTGHLSLAAEGFFRRLQDYMWLHSPDYCSISVNPAEWVLAGRCSIEEAKKAMEEVQNDFCPLLKEEESRLVCLGLRKKRGEQVHMSEKRKAAADARWKKGGSGKHASASKKHASASKTNASASKRDANGMHPAGVGVGVGVQEGGVGGENGGNLPFHSKEFVEEWTAFELHRKQSRAKLTAVARSRALKKLAGMGEQNAIIALRHTLEHGYRGIFSPSGFPGSKPESKPMKGRHTPESA